VYLFLLIVFLISYGSLYPFDFVQIGNDAFAIKEFFQTWGTYTHRGDILANLLLFVPFGVTGVQMLLPKNNHTLVIPFVLVLGLCLAIVLQFGQIYLPSRDANLSDAVLNFVGTIIGVLIAISLNTNRTSFAGVIYGNDSFPMLILFSWMAYRLMPFVPSIDLQQLKNGIKPIFLFSTWELVRIFHDAISWLVVFYILCRHKQKNLSMPYLSRLIFCCFILEVIIVDNSVSMSNAVGGILALVSWWAFFSYTKKLPVWLATMMVVVLFASGFSPYQQSDTTQEMQLIPFYGFLGGSMLVNTASFLEKFFLYGALIWLFQGVGLKFYWAILITVGVTVCIEVGQIFLVGHLAEVTDPFLVLLIGSLIATLQRKTRVLTDN